MQVFRRVPTAKSCILDGNYGRVMTSILVFFFTMWQRKRERASEREREREKEIRGEIKKR